MFMPERDHVAPHRESARSSVQVGGYAMGQNHNEAPRCDNTEGPLTSNLGYQIGGSVEPILSAPGDSSRAARPVETRGMDLTRSDEVAQAGLASIIRGLCASTDIADPRHLASLAVAQIDDARLRDELEAAAVAVARGVIHSLRTHHSGPASQSRGDDHDDLAGRASSPSSYGRAALVRQWAAAQLRSRVHVSAGWKLLRDCTFEDLAFAAAERRIMAARNETAAEQYDRLAKALADAGASTVAELAEPTFAAAWRAAA